MQIARRAGTCAGLLAIAAAGLIGAAPEAAAKGQTLLVAMNGSDSNSCGGKGNPCQTLGQAMENAQPGATILVGPGRYGDVNGQFWDVRLESGEEDHSARQQGGDLEPPCAAAKQARVGVGSQEHCMFEIRKPLRIVSEQGAAATVLHAGGVHESRTPLALNAVGIFSSGVTLGEPGHGFTIKAGLRGVFIRHPGDGSLSGVRIAGNIISGALEQPIDVEDDTFCVACRIEGNVTFGNGLRPPTQIQLSDIYAGNSVYAGNVDVNANSVFRGLSFAGEVSGNLFLASRVDGFQGDVFGLLFGNVALGSELHGFSVGSGSSASAIANAAIGNRIGLLTTTGPSSQVPSWGNLLLGNGDCGARLRQAFVVTGPSPGPFHGNAVYGNGVGRFSKNGGPPGLVANGCGVDAEQQDLSDNFWGSPSGPGGDPADAVYGLGNTWFPVAPKEIKFKRKSRKPTL